MDVEFEIKYRDEQIKDLKEELAGTKRERRLEDQLQFNPFKADSGSRTVV